MPFLLIWGSGCFVIGGGGFVYFVLFYQKLQIAQSFGLWNQHLIDIILVGLHFSRSVNIIPIDSWHLFERTEDLVVLRIIVVCLLVWLFK